MQNSTKNPYRAWEHLNRPTDLFKKEKSFYTEILFPKKKENGICAIVKKILGDNHATLQTNYFIGVDRFPGTNQCLYVEPKINRISDSSHNEDLIEVDYLRMLFDSLSNPALLDDLDELLVIKWDEEEINLENKDDFLTPFLVVQFLGVLKSIVKKGLKKSYYLIKTNLNNRIKGRVLVSQTIKKNHFHHKYLDNICSYEEFGLNGIENRLLKKTLEFVKPYLNAHNHLGLKNGKSLENLFNYINPAFAQVSSEFDFSELKKIKSNSFYKNYGKAVELSEKILRRFGYNISNSSKHNLKSTPPFWIDMSKLFELYVLSILRKKFGNAIQFQFKSNGNELDYILKNNEFQMVIDAKYKLKYETSYHIEDIRQISGYARLSNVRSRLDLDGSCRVPECLIIYPDTKGKIEDFNISNLRQFPIPGFHNLYKLKVPLPTL